MPRAGAAPRQGLTRLAPSRSRPHRDPGRADRRARPGTPGRTETGRLPGGTGGSQAGIHSFMLLPATRTARGTHARRREQAAAVPFLGRLILRQSPGEVTEPALSPHASIPSLVEADRW